MKNVFILMLGLVAGTASFAQTTDSKVPTASISVVDANRLKLTIGQEQTTATVSLLDAEGHILYTQNANLRDGLSQYFNIAALNQGAYRLEVAVGKEAVVKTFVIGEQPAQKFVSVGS